MKSTTIARNYAEALLLAAEARGGDAAERYGELLDAVTGAVRADERIAVALESPRVAKATKARLLASALAGVAPPDVVRFLQAVVRRGRQGLLADISAQYQELLDVKLNRIHAGITLAAAPDSLLEKQIVDRLAQAFGREVRAYFRADQGILGGVIVRIGDRVFDGSVRRRIAALRRRLLVGSEHAP